MDNDQDELLAYCKRHGFTIDHWEDDGTTPVGCCIFHADRTPSMHIYHGSGGRHAFVKCYGCEVNADYHRAILLLEFSQFGDKPSDQEWAIVDARVRELRGQPPKEDKEEKREKVERIKNPPATREQQIMMGLLMQWSNAMLTHSPYAKAARRWCASEGIRCWPYPLQMGFMPSFYDHPELEMPFIRFLKQGLKDQFGHDDWADLAVSTGIIYDSEKANPRLHDRVIFFCTNPTTGNVMFYQARSILDVKQENAQRKAEGRAIIASYTAPRGIQKYPYILPLATPRRKGTIIVESPKGVPLFWQPPVQMKTLAELGSGFESWFLELAEPPFYVMTDHDELKMGRNGQQYCPGDKLAAKIMQAAAGYGYPAYRIKPPSPILKDPNKWVIHSGFDPILAALEVVDATYTLAS